MRSARRGTGSDVAGSRPYRPGDDIDTIDWDASARLSAARAPTSSSCASASPTRRRASSWSAIAGPEMSLFPDWLPWLSKPEAVRTATLMIADSTIAARGLGGYLDLAEGDVFWRPPRSQREEWRLEQRRPFGAPQDTVTLSFQHSRPCGRRCRRGASSSSSPTSSSAVERRSGSARSSGAGTSCPSCVQDPTWERTFPDVSGAMRASRRSAHGRRDVPASRRAARPSSGANGTRSAGSGCSHVPLPRRRAGCRSRAREATRSSTRSSGGRRADALEGAGDDAEAVSGRALALLGAAVAVDPRGHALEPEPAVDGRLASGQAGARPRPAPVPAVGALRGHGARASRRDGRQETARPERLRLETTASRTSHRPARV